jgi:hypothetical protein
MTRHIMTVKVRGRTFPSSQACADHFGILRSSVYYAIDKGTTENLGQDGVQGRRRRFTYRDLSWPSQSAASRALGFNRQYIGSMLAKGPRERELLEGHLAAYYNRVSQ